MNIVGNHKSQRSLGKTHQAGPQPQYSMKISAMQLL